MATASSFPQRVTHWLKTCLTVLSLLTVPIYFRGFYKNTLLPIRAIVESNDQDESKVNLVKWLQAKTREAQYVSIAGAVIFASTTQSLSWPALTTSHWSATALLYACIILAIPSILLGTQQLSVLPEVEDIRSMTANEINRMRDSFLSSSSRLSSANATREISTFVLFVWQAPRMFLAAFLGSFIGSLICVVISSVAINPGWNAEAKTALIFGCVGVFTLTYFIAVTLGVHRLIEGK